MHQKWTLAQLDEICLCSLMAQQNPVLLSIATSQHTALLSLLLLYSKSQSLPHEHFLSSVHMFFDGGVDALDVQCAPYNKWHMASASICALLELLHLASLPQCLSSLLGFGSPTKLLAFFSF